MHRFLISLLACTLFALGCCHDPQPLTDAGPPAVDAGPAWPALLAATPEGLVEPDLSCLSLRTAPRPGATVDVATPVVPFGAPPSVTIPGVPVFFHLDGAVTPSCEAPGCVVAVADDAGVATARLPEGGWVTTEIPPIDGPDPMRSFMRTIELQWAAGAEDTINLFNRGTLAGFEAALGTPVDPSRGLAAGRVRDCQDRPLTEARLRWFAADGAPIEDARTLYFDGAAPPGLALDAQATAPDGLYAAIDLPVGAVRVEAWGAVAGGEPTRVACEELPAFADTLSVQVLRPLRSDAPASCR